MLDHKYDFSNKISLVYTYPHELVGDPPDQFRYRVYRGSDYVGECWVFTRPTVEVLDRFPVFGVSSNWFNDICDEFETYLKEHLTN